MRGEHKKYETACIVLQKNIRRATVSEAVSTEIVKTALISSGGEKINQSHSLRTRSKKRCLQFDNVKDGEELIRGISEMASLN